MESKNKFSIIVTTVAIVLFAVLLTIVFFVTRDYSSKRVNVYSTQNGITVSLASNVASNLKNGTGKEFNLSTMQAENVKNYLYVSSNKAIRLECDLDIRELDNSVVEGAWTTNLIDNSISFVPNNSEESIVISLADNATIIEATNENATPKLLIRWVDAVSQRGLKTDTEFNKNMMPLIKSIDGYNAQNQQKSVNYKLKVTVGSASEVTPILLSSEEVSAIKTKAANAECICFYFEEDFEDNMLSTLTGSTLVSGGSIQSAIVGSTLYVYTAKSNVIVAPTDATALFKGLENLTSLQLYNFYTKNVTKADELFADDTMLATVYADRTSVNWGKVTSANSMFSSCSNLKGYYTSDGEIASNGLTIGVGIDGAKIADSSGGYFTNRYINVSLDNDEVINEPIQNTINGLAISNWVYGESANSPTVVGVTYGNKSDIVYNYASVIDGTVGQYSTQVPSHAGNYRLKATIPAFDNYLEASSTTDFAITKADNQIINLAISSWTYLDQPSTPSVDSVKFGNKDDIVFTYASLENGEAIDYGAISNLSSNTPAGEYRVKVFLSGTNDYNDLIDYVDFTVFKKQISKPDAGTTRFYYTGDLITYNIDSSDDYVVTNNTGTEVGGYYATVTLSDPINTKWDDNTIEPLSYPFDIVAKTPASVATHPSGANNLVFDNTAKQLISTAGTSNDGTLCYKLSTSTIWTNNYKDIVATFAGSYEIEYKVVPTNSVNYCDSQTYTLNVAIAPQEITAPTENNSTFTYNATEQTYTLTTNPAYRITNNTRTNAGSQMVIVSLVDKTNTVWANAEVGRETVDLEFEFVIAMAQNVISNLSIANWTCGENANTPQITKASFIEASDIVYAYAEVIDNVAGEYTSNVPTEVGDYCIKATVQSTSNYVGVELTANFSILAQPVAAVITAPIGAENLIYNSSAQQLLTFAGTAENGTLMYKLSTESNYTTDITTITATDAGGYIIDYFVDANAGCVDSQVYTLPVTIAKATNSLSWGADTYGWTYGEANPVYPSAIATDGTVVIEYKVQGANDSTYSSTTPTNAGSYTVRASVATTSNYLAASETKDFVIAQATYNMDNTSIYVISSYDKTAKGIEIQNLPSKDITPSVVYWIDDENETVTPINAGSYHFRISYETSDPNYKTPADWYSESIVFVIEPIYLGIERDYTIYEGEQIVPTILDPTMIIEGDDVSVVVTDPLPTAPRQEAYSLDIGLVGDDANNYSLNSTNKTINVTILEKSPVGYTAPTAVENLVYSGNLLALISAGTSEYGEFTYSLEENGTYTSNIPTCSNAGEYTVYYKVTPTQQYAVQYNEATGSVVVTIAKATNTLTWGAANYGWTYGEANPVYPTATATDGTVIIEYKVQGADDSTYSGTTPTNAGSYTVRASVATTSNYLAVSETKDFVIAPQEITAPTENNSTFTYNATEQTYTLTTNPAYTITNNTRTNAGSQMVIVSLTDKTNTVWANAEVGQETADIEFEFVIAMAQNVISNLSIANWTYGENASTPQITKASFIEASDIVYTYTEVIDNVAGEYTSNVPTEVGDYSVKATVQTTSNYVGVELTASFSILSQPVAAVITAPTGAQNLIYNSSAQQLLTSAGTAENGTLKYKLSTESNFALDYTTVTATNAGEYTVDYFVEANAGYSSSQVYTLTVTIAQATNSILGLAITGWSEGDTPNVPSVTSVAFGNVADIVYTYGELVDDTWTYSSTVPTAAGDYRVKATLAGNANYATTETYVNFSISAQVELTVNSLVSGSEFRTILQNASIEATSLQHIYFGNKSTYQADLTTFMINGQGLDITDNHNGEIKVYCEGSLGLLYILSEDDNTIYANADCRGMLDGMTALTNVTIRNLDTSNTTNTSYMFNDCASLATIEIDSNTTNWDLSNVNDSTYMFAGCGLATDPDVVDKTNAVVGRYLTEYSVNQ